MRMAGSMSGPALSPDGKSIVFFTDRDRHSLDVVLADTATGTIRRKLISTAVDPHFESLQFIDSVGAWAPNGQRFALAALSGGRPVLTLLDVTTGDIERELPIPGVDQVFNPTWSPDGRQIAFSALRNGFSDLYVLDLETDRGPSSHNRCVRRSPAILVAGRPDHRVLDRSIFVVHSDVDLWQFSAGSARRRICGDHRTARHPGCKTHRPALVRRRLQPLFRCRRAEHQQHLSRVDRRWNTFPRDRCLHGRQRCNCPESGAGNGGTSESARIQRVSSREV